VNTAAPKSAIFTYGNEYFKIVHGYDLFVSSGEGTPSSHHVIESAEHVLRLDVAVHNALGITLRRDTSTVRQSSESLVPCLSDSRKR